MTPSEYARLWASKCERWPHQPAWELGMEYYANTPKALLDIQYEYFDDPWFAGEFRGNIAATLLCFLAAMLEDK